MSSSKHSRYAFLLAGLGLLVAACSPGGPNPNTAAQSSAPAESAAPEAAPQAAAPPPSVEPAIPVIAERLPYAEVDDELVYGHFVFPADMVEPLPAVIMIHEEWGLNDHVREMADRLAGEGYIVLAIDLFGGSSTTDPELARQQMVKVVENPESARENIRQAYAFVSDIGGAPRAGSLGWDFGGGWSLEAAMLFPEDLDAAVIIYGQVTDDEERLRPINVPLLGLFAGRDRSISEESVQGFEQALERLRKNYDVHVYPYADHAFADPSAATYNAEVAEDAWQRTVEFFDLHLAIGGSDSG